MITARTAAPDALFVVNLNECAEGVFAVDPHSRIVFWNDAAQGLLGYSAPETLGIHCGDLLESGGSDSAACAMCLRASTRPNAKVLATFEMNATTRTGVVKCLHVTTMRAASASGAPRIIHLLREHSPVHAALPMDLADDDPTAAQSAPRLTNRELEVLRLLASGMSNAEIAGALSISPITARNHVTRVIEKLEVKTRLQAVIAASRQELI
jgi:PAS domain S-box-containing protein